MGKLMDRVMANVDLDAAATPGLIRAELAVLKPICAWTAGAWTDLGGMKWNELQNTPHHVRMLSNYLVRAHAASRRESR